MSEDDLAARRKGDKTKVSLALEIRGRTTMPLAWIASRLKMGTRGYLTWLFYRANPSARHGSQAPARTVEDFHFRSLVHRRQTLRFLKGQHFFLLLPPRPLHLYREQLQMPISPHF